MDNAATAWIARLFSDTTVCVAGTPISVKDVYPVAIDASAHGLREWLDDQLGNRFDLSRILPDSCVIISIDVETSGSSHTKCSLLSVGLVIWTMTGQEIGAFKVNLKPFEEPLVMQSETWHGFYSKPENLGALEGALAAPEDPRSAAMQIALIVRYFLDNYDDVHLAADNPAFDLKFLDDLLCRAGMLPLRYHARKRDGSIVYKGKVLDIATLMDTTAYVLGKTESYPSTSGLSALRKLLGLDDAPYKHDHDPVNDARLNAYCAVQCLGLLDAYKRR